MNKNIERFYKYISIDSQSDPKSDTVPSSPGQMELGKVVVEDLKEIGITDVVQDDHGYIYATIPGNVEGVPTFGLVVHLDTAVEMNGKCDNPQIVDYKGGDIKLNDQFTMKVEDFPFLEDLVGETLITTDGTTLLGADNKAGIVILLAVADHLLTHPEIPHGDIRLAITPDEEIGRGPAKFDVEQFGCDFAYTVDGGLIGGMEYENFNAASAFIKIQGKNVHPGSAKNVMVNALRIALEIESMLPGEQKPEYTEGYEGFFLLDVIEGNVEEARMEYLIRDHSIEAFNQKKEMMEDIVAFLNKKYGDNIQLEIEDTYYNMREKIEPHIEIINMLEQSMVDAGVEPDIKPIRGGSDGAQLSYKGLPCPNMFTGGYNFHGRYEFLSIDQMNKAIEVIIKLAENNVKMHQEK
ncbi:peptidase T [Facklamia miroungae]|uniref:Peptidase T n=1 Tax=Facklamia miroungae TaxID=120956 RepID=A0A1G7Q9D4_9LACT|nr:peptidase T [Facklamia miroungae]NKZ28866.1 peptidase T [Facklamia miroungae]SDF95065.1 tripeptide aminopeptidase [Facklamia miroungae]